MSAHLHQILKRLSKCWFWDSWIVMTAASSANWKSLVSEWSSFVDVAVSVIFSEIFVVCWKKWSSRSERSSSFKTCTILQLLRCIFKPRTPLQNFPQQHLTMLEFTIAYVVLIICVVNLAAWFSVDFSALFILALQRHAWQPSETKSFPQNKHTTQNNNAKMIRARIIPFSVINNWISRRFKYYNFN